MEEVMEMQSKMTFNFEKIRQESEWQWRSFLLCKKISLRESTPCSVTFDGGMDSKECFSSTSILSNFNLTTVSLTVSLIKRKNGAVFQTSVFV